MKRITLFLIGTAAVLVLLFGYSSSQQGLRDQVPEYGNVATQGSGTGSPTVRSHPTFTGTVEGPAVTTEWGPVQVRVTIKHNRITEVRVPQYPRDNPRSQQINARALPMLVDETLQAQSAEIDMVTGATLTSKGYVKSLQAALDKAGW